MADLLFARLGPADHSHPEEYARIMTDLAMAGVEVVVRSGTLAYSPCPGQPGRMILDPEASIAAVRHEYQHFLDHRTASYPGFKPYYQNPHEFCRLEVRGYLREVWTARETGHDDLVPAILQQMRERVGELLGGF